MLVCCYEWIEEWIDGSMGVFPVCVLCVRGRKERRCFMLDLDLSQASAGA